MVWPITGAKSYVCETGKSMNAMGLAVAQEDGWRYIAITLIDGGFECNGLIATISGEPFKMEFPFSGYFIERPRLHDSIQGVLTEARRFSSNPLHPDNG
jgi:hypothetical protein